MSVSEHLKNLVNVVSENDNDLQVPENANKGSGDTEKIFSTSKVENTDESPQSSDKAAENVTNLQVLEHTKVTPKFVDENIDQKCVSEGKELANEIVANDTQIRHDNVHSASADLKIGNMSTVSEQTAYKETVLDDVSESDLELRWTDEDDIEQDCPPLSDEALKELDKELGITDLVPDTEPVLNLIESQDLNVSVPKVDVGQHSIVESVQAVPKSQEIGIASDSKIPTDNLDQSVDQDASIEQTIDADKDTKQAVEQDKDESADKGIEETVKELEQLMDQDNDKVAQKSDFLVESTESDIVNTDDVNVAQSIQSTINVIKDIQPMDIDDLSEIVNFESSNEKAKSSEFASERDIIEEPKDINEPTAMAGVDDENILEPSNKTIEENQNEKVDSTIKNVTELSKKSTESDKNTSDNIEIVHTENAGEVNMVKNKQDSTVSEESNSTDIIKVENIITEETVEFITPDVTNESMKINTEHRINRPDVMLDIPTQEFDFDDFDDTLDKQAHTEKNRENDISSKTVTEIVNQLSKDIEIDIKTEGATKTIADIKEAEDDSNIVVCDCKAGRKEQIQSEDNSEPVKSVAEDNTVSESTIKQDEPPKLDVISATISSSEFVESQVEGKCPKETEALENTDKKTGADEMPPTSDSKITIDKEKEPQVCSASNEIAENIDMDENKSKASSDESVEKNTETDAKLPTNDAKSSTDTEKAPEICLESNETAETIEKRIETSNETEISLNTETKEIGAEPYESAENYEEKTKSDVQKPTDTTEKLPDDSKSVEITEKIEKQSESAAEVEEAQEKIEDAKPSTSDTKMSSDAEESQEVADSLGLLAESSRVMNEDDEDEQDPDEEGDGDDDADGDDDDDFDPDEEGSSNHISTGENSEESNPPHSELDIQEDGLDIVYGSDADPIGLISDSNDANDGFDALLGDSIDVPTVSAAKSSIELGEKDKEQPDLKEKGEDKSKESDKSPKPKERKSSILSDILSKPDITDSSKSNAVLNALEKLKKKIEDTSSVVHLEGSSEEDDVQGIKDKQAPPGVTCKHQDKGSVAVPAPLSTDSGIHVSANTKDASKDESKMGEIFNLDSDEDDKLDVKKQADKPRGNSQCINYNCTSDESVNYYLADRVTIAYYGAARRRQRPVCQNCLDIVTARNEGLLSGMKDLRPLMSLRMSRPAHQLLEISDSDSEGEDDPLGEGGAKILEADLADLFNNTWTKYNMDARLKETEDYLEAELDKMQKKSEEIDKILRECQKNTDTLRVNFYASFEPSRKDLPALSIHDTPIASYACPETEEQFNEASQLSMRQPKRRSSGAIEIPAKKQAVNLQSYMENDKKVTRAGVQDQMKHEEDKDISVVRLSAECAPPELPPVGEPQRPPLRVGEQVYAMKSQYGAWLLGRVLEILPKHSEFTHCRIKFDHKLKNPCKVLPARSLAYTEPSEVRMTIGMRVIALFENADPTIKRDSFYYSGVVAEIPNPVNNYRYLIFFDDGYVQYVHHKLTRLIYESSPLVWDEVHPLSRDFVYNYLNKYPERPMVRMHRGQSLTVEWNRKWWETSVLEVDAALVMVKFPNGRIEWIYRGSTRLQPLFTEFQAARRGDRTRLPRSTKVTTKTNMPYVEYTRSAETAIKAEVPPPPAQSEDLRRQRAVAKKSTSVPQPPTAVSDGVVSRVVFYTPKNSVRPYKMVPHTCGTSCNRSDLLTLKELRTYNPLTKPLLSGWERQIIRHKYSREVMYRAPCGRRLRNIVELHHYLRTVDSEMAVDLFDFNPNTHCLAEFVLNKTNVQKKDLSHGKENVPVPCVNYYDHSLPEFCSYNTERTPTAGVPLNLDPDFLCGCDCDDDCVDKTKCACWKMTLEGARTIGIEGDNIGYEYRRLPEPLPSGIYECNSRCKCKQTCLNRVVQNPLQLKLQVFKTLNRGWGIRALNDVPKGAFLCIYAGNLLTDATANLDGLNEGDEYLAELDYIEVVEAMKDGYEEDIPDADKKLDKKESKKAENEPETESSESEEEQKVDKNDIEDGDFRPVNKYLGRSFTEFNKRLRRRDKKIKGEEESKEMKEEQKKDDDDCITISDDEEVRVSQREPSRFTAQEGMSDSKVVPKYRSIRTYFGKDEACYIMDAKVQGNIGRYLNHSCSPNVFVQNVFVDTHDPRFPWVSFFALHHIRAGTELTWNYNYDIGSVPGKVLYCFCGAPNCRGRLL